MIKYIPLPFFVIVFLCQYFTWTKLNTLDVSMWAEQAEYVTTNNPKQFDFAMAYGHPGATVIDGTILTHFLTGLPYPKSIVVFLAFFNALITVLTVILCFQASRTTWWWLGTLTLFVFNYQNLFATPPSAVSALLINLFFLATLVFKPVRWVIIAGLLLATRADIGALAIVGFLLFLKTRLSFKKIFLLFTGVCLVFFVVNPYMWYMPVQHLRDLMHKITWHYAEFTSSAMPVGGLLKISGLAMVSVFLTLTWSFVRKIVRFPLPVSLVLSLGLITIAGVSIILTSRYQTARYFTPFIYLWELILPLLVFTLAKHTRRYKLISILIIIFFALSQTYLSFLDSGFRLR